MVMKMNKVLIKLYVPSIEEQFDILLPLNKKIGNIITLLVKAINEFSGGYYQPKDMPILYDKLTSQTYNLNLNVKDAGIINGTELILM